MKMCFQNFVSLPDDFLTFATADFILLLKTFELSLPAHVLGAKLTCYH